MDNIIFKYFPDLTDIQKKQFSDLSDLYEFWNAQINVVSRKDMSDFLEDFDNYDDCVPAGVRLPKIEIDEKYYKELGVSSDISNYDFLIKLCHKGVKDRDIDKLQPDFQM